MHVISVIFKNLIDKSVDVNENFVAEISIKIFQIIESFNIIKNN